MNSHFFSMKNLNSFLTFLFWILFSSIGFGQTFDRAYDEGFFANEIECLANGYLLKRETFLTDSTVERNLIRTNLRGYKIETKKEFFSKRRRTPSNLNITDKNGNHFSISVGTVHPSSNILDSFSVRRINEMGNLAYENNFDVPYADGTTYFNVGYKLAEALDGNVFVVWHFLSPGSSFPSGFKLCKISPIGELLFSEGMQENEFEVLYSVKKIIDGGIYGLAANCDIASAQSNRIIKYSAQGKWDWDFSIKDYPLDISQEFFESSFFTNDNHFILTLKKEAGGFIAIKMNEFGHEVRTFEYNANGLFLEDAKQTADGGYIFLGSKIVNGERIIFLVKTKNDFSIVQPPNTLDITGYFRNAINDSDLEMEEELFAIERGTVFPSPASDELKLHFFSSKSISSEIQIFDTSGKLVLIEKVNFKKGLNKQQINISTLENGNYFIKIISFKRVLAQNRFLKSTN